MRYLLIPVKDLAHAKQRLSWLMTQEERTRLAWEMLVLTLDLAARVRNADRVAMVTSYQPALELAGRYGMEVIRETEQVSESASVDSASRELERKGALAVLRLPIDLPLLTHEEIEQVLERDSPGTGAVIVPSRDGSGTNAILRRPPTLFPSHFGPGSLDKHKYEAELLNLKCDVIAVEGIALDIDEPEDLIELFRQPRRSIIRDLLVEMGIEERLQRRETTEHTE